MLLLEKRDRDRLTKQTFFCLVMITFGAFVVFDDRTENRLTDFDAIYGWLLVVLFGFYALDYLRFSFFMPPTLSATREGISVKTDFNPAYGPIKWEEIAGFDVVAGGEDEEDKLRIYIGEPTAVFDRLGQWPKIALIDRALSDPIDLPGRYFGRHVSDVAEDLARLRQQQIQCIEAYDLKNGK
ncbi:MAG: STM3941 family protein [Pseudomonadota bacterium]